MVSLSVLLLIAVMVEVVLCSSRIPMIFLEFELAELMLYYIHHACMTVMLILCPFEQKTATAVAYCKRGNGLIKVNGVPLHLVQPETLSMKVIL